MELIDGEREYCDKLIAFHKARIKHHTEVLKALKERFE